MTLPVITEGNPILRARAAEVADCADPDIQKLIDDMIPTMYEKDGIGLAAPQVGASVRIAVIVPDPERFEDFRYSRTALVLINPTIVRHSWRMESGEEGCLSVPNMYGQVRRWKSLTATYLDRDGTHQTIRAKGLMARVIQHEIDHLNGILFIDKAKNTYRIRPS